MLGACAGGLECMCEPGRRDNVYGRLCQLIVSMRRGPSRASQSKSTPGTGGASTHPHSTASASSVLRGDAQQKKLGKPATVRLTAFVPSASMMRIAIVTLPMIIRLAVLRVSYTDLC